jgi:hypothetical protein
VVRAGAEAEGENREEQNQDVFHIEGGSHLDPKTRVRLSPYLNIRRSMGIPPDFGTALLRARPVFFSLPVMFERRTEKIASISVFVRRMAGSLGIAFGLCVVALAIGIAGYHWIAGLMWVDAFLDASMILGGMGPVSPLTTQAAKIFAALYALFSGLMFIGIVGVTISPILHRMLHHFHVDDEDMKVDKD